MDKDIQKGITFVEASHSKMDINVSNCRVLDMTSNALEAVKVQSQAQEKAAKYQYSDPVRFRERNKLAITILVIFALLVVVIVAVFKCESSQLENILITTIITLGGAWGVSKIVQEFKK
jgi:hypothetical protein